MDDRCRIGNEPATRSLGRYRFCERHYQRALRQRGSLWRADLISLLVLAAFVVIVYAVDALLKPNLSGTSLITVGVVVALVPAVLWLIFFYRWDALEPEPKEIVIPVAVTRAVLWPSHSNDLNRVQRGPRSCADARSERTGIRR